MDTIKYIIVLRVKMVDDVDNFISYVKKTLRDFGLPLIYKYKKRPTTINIDKISDSIDFNSFDSDLYMLLDNVYNDDYGDLLLTKIEIINGRLLRITLRRKYEF